jgi:hypothetical protein
MKAMNVQNRYSESLRSAYVLGLLGVLGVFAMITAVLVAYPALAYLGAKFF